MKVIISQHQGNCQHNNLQVKETEKFENHQPKMENGLKSASGIGILYQISKKRSLIAATTELEFLINFYNFTVTILL